MGLWPARRPARRLAGRLRQVTLGGAPGGTLVKDPIGHAIFVFFCVKDPIGHANFLLARKGCSANRFKKDLKANRPFGKTFQIAFWSET